MEENLSCDVCNSEYDVSTAIPKVLQCGHSFCRPCVTNFIKDSLNCPNCRSRISVDATSIPTNYSILGILDAYKSMETSKCDLVCSVDVIKNKYLQEKDTLSKKKSQIETSLKIIDKGLDKITELTDDDHHEIDTWKTRKILIKLGKDFKRVVDFGHFNYLKFRNSVSVSLKSFENPEKYLNEIYQRLQKEEKIYGAHLIKGRVMYGKVSVYDNKLIFHSLTLREIPQKSSLIWFDELKECIDRHNFHPFIKISCDEKNMTYTVNIRMFDKHLSNQFIKLCTGECGPSYKGSSYKKGHDKHNYVNVLHVESFIENDCEMGKSIEYIYSGDEIACKVGCNKNEMFIRLNPLGSFDIYRTLITGEVMELTHGKLMSPSKLYDLINYSKPSCLKIIDCGIVLYVQ